MCSASNIIWLVIAIASIVMPLLMVFGGFLEKKRIEKRGRFHVRPDRP